MPPHFNFRYDFDKNSCLLANRGIGFEEIITEIKNGNLINIKQHHNSKKYPDQNIMFVKCLDRIYLVLFIKEPDNTYFLKTLFPSRKATKEYL